MQKQGQIAAGIDVGTANVRCVIGVPAEDNVQPSIIGAGSAPNSGMRKGSIINVEDTAHAIVSAVEEAERISGQNVTSATISINGGHIIGLNSKGVIAISSDSKEISFEDLERAEEAATVVQLPPNREILQVFAKNYHLDGQDNIKDPIGMSGVRLEVDAHIVTAATPAVKNMERTLDVANIGIKHKILAGLASAEAVLEPKQRESGTVVVDFGAGTTNVIVYEEDDVQHVAVLPVGSINLTNDLAIGLKTDLDIAEKVKIEHAKALAASAGRKERIKIEDDEEQAHVFEREDVDAVIQARLGELFDLVDRELKKINRSRKLPGGVVLVGGGSKLPMIDEFVKLQLQLPARIAKPKHFTGIIDATDDPAFACAVGLMMLDMHMGGSTSSRTSSGAGMNNLFTSVKNVLGKFKP